MGFGILFLLWMIGSAGGGDVKLIGGLSVWLGAALTLRVLLCSLIFVMVGTMGMMVYGVLSQGLARTKKQLLEKKAVGGKSKETVGDRQKRRVMAFAVPVALATWCVLLIFRAHW